MKFNIYTKDAKVIEKTYSLLQMINMIVCGIIALTSLILTIVIACEEEVLWLIPLGALVAVSLIYCLIANSLQIKYGMYYDIRKIRTLTENNCSEQAADDNALPEL